MEARAVEVESREAVGDVGIVAQQVGTGMLSNQHVDAGECDALAAIGPRDADEEKSGRHRGCVLTWHGSLVSWGNRGSLGEAHADSLLQAHVAPAPRMHACWTTGEVPW